MNRQVTVETRLHARYGHLVAPGGGVSSLTAVEPMRCAVEDLVRFSNQLSSVDPVLTSYGATHLRRIRETRNTHDGRTVVLHQLDGERLSVGSAGYFDMLATCDFLAAEAVAGTDWPARDLADRLAHGDPLHRGDGRAASVGVSVLTVFDLPPKPAFLLGRRRPDLATDGGMWHVAPSGMMEPDPVEPLVATVRRELAEELGVELTDEARSGLTVLGISHDLLRLRPEVCLLLRLPPGVRPVVRSEEFDACRAVPTAAVAQVLDDATLTLTAPARGTLALAAAVMHPLSGA